MEEKYNWNLQDIFENEEQFKKENCSKCKKNIDCKITRRIDGRLTCSEEE